MRWCLTALLLVACGRADGGGSAGAEAEPRAEVGTHAGTGAASISEAEWLELTGPQPGVHEVYDAACGGERIAQEYRITPSVGCALRRGDDGMFTPGLTRDCAVADYCASAGDCTEQPGGVCRGNAYASCAYPGLDAEAAPCERDTDCNALPGGSCMPRLEGGGTRCYPTGECSVTPMQGCTYPALGQPCSSDADCSAAPGGSCRHVLFTECAYNECDAADDCGPAARCECQGVRRCVPAGCFSDTDCAAGYPCEGSLAIQCGNLNPVAGYHCHAAVDECQGDADCNGDSCVFDPDVARWACRDVRCFDR